MAMNEQQARYEAAKRERHKSKHMTHKRWEAVHDSVKGWHVALVDNFKPMPVSSTPMGDSSISLGDMLLIALDFHRRRMEQENGDQG